MNYWFRICTAGLMAGFITYALINVVSALVETMDRIACGEAHNKRC